MTRACSGVHGHLWAGLSSESFHILDNKGTIYIGVVITKVLCQIYLKACVFNPSLTKPLFCVAQMSRRNVG